MKKLVKIFLLFVLMIFLGFSVYILSLFYPIPFIYSIVEAGLHYYPWLSYVFAGYSAAVCLGFFILLLLTVFSTNKSNLLIIKKQKGEIQFSKKTIESTVRYSFADLNGISSSKIKIKLNRNPDKTKVYVKVYLNDTRGLALLTETLQEKISDAMQASLNIAVKSITVRVLESDSDNTAKKENTDDISEHSSII